MTANKAQKKTRLLHVFSTFNIGGPQVRFAQLANAWGDQFDHIIIAQDGNTNAVSLLNPELTFEVLQAPSSKPGLLSRALAYRKMLRTLRPDKLITYNWGAIEWSLVHWGLKTQHLHIEDGFGPEEQVRRLSRRNWFRRFALLRTKRIIVPSKTLLQIATSEWGIAIKRLSYIPNGVDCEALKNPDREAFQPWFKDSMSRIKIGTLARIRKEKNIPRLLHVVESLMVEYPIELYIGGDGPEYSTIESYVNSSPDLRHIHLLGNVERPGDFLCHLDIFALSSDTEQMPYSVLEACATGLPIASLDVGDVNSMVALENREWITGKQDDDLLLSLSTLIQNETLRQQIGTANQAFCATHFSFDVMQTAYRQLFD